MREFFSQHSIDDSVDFYPMFKQAKKQGIAQELLQGTIVAVRFTKAKVFYDVISDYYGIVFENVDSAKVFKQTTLPLPLDETKED